MVSRDRDLKEQLLAAALRISGGNVDTTFTSEQLLVEAWKVDPVAWGLRGFEHQHPDSHRVHRELDSRGKGAKGVVALGDLERVDARIYRLTPKGMAKASRSQDGPAPLGDKVARVMEREIEAVLKNPVFQSWLKDPETPKRFQGAGVVWGVAPGTPPKVIRDRINRQRETLLSAREALDESQRNELTDGRGRVLFTGEDIDRCLEFHRTLLDRFHNDLTILGVDGIDAEDSSHQG